MTARQGVGLQKQTGIRKPNFGNGIQKKKAQARMKKMTGQQVKHCILASHCSTENTA